MSILAEAGKMHRLFGIETEYGIVVDGLGANDWITESIALVRSHAGCVARGVARARVAGRVGVEFTSAIFKPLF